MSAGPVPGRDHYATKMSMEEQEGAVKMLRAQMRRFRDCLLLSNDASLPPGVFPTDSSATYDRTS